MKISTLFTSVIALFSTVVYASPTPNMDELAKLQKVLNSKRLACKNGDRTVDFRLSVDQLPTIGPIGNANKVTIYTTSVDGEGVGAPPASVDAVAVGEILTVSFRHDEGFALLFLNSDSYYWDAKSECSTGKLIVSRDPSVGEDNTLNATQTVTCCKQLGDK